MLFGTRGFCGGVELGFIVTEPCGFEQIRIRKGPMRLFWSASSVLVLKVEMTEIVPKNTGISIVAGRLFVVAILTRARRLRGRLLLFSV